MRKREKSNASWGETALFCYPDDILPNGVYFATIKVQDGNKDNESALNGTNDSSNMLSPAANYIDGLDDVSVRVADKFHRGNQMHHQTIITIDRGAQSKEIKLLGNKLILRC